MAPAGHSVIFRPTILYGSWAGSITNIELMKVSFCAILGMTSRDHISNNGCSRSVDRNNDRFLRCDHTDSPSWNATTSPVRKPDGNNEGEHCILNDFCFRNPFEARKVTNKMMKWVGTYIEDVWLTNLLLTMWASKRAWSKSTKIWVFSSHADRTFRWPNCRSPGPPLERTLTSEQVWIKRKIIVGISYIMILLGDRI